MTTMNPLPHTLSHSRGSDWYFKKPVALFSPLFVNACCISCDTSLDASVYFCAIIPVKFPSRTSTNNSNHSLVDLNIHLATSFYDWPRGLMDKASDFGSED